jgi:hypothetical protein
VLRTLDSLLAHDNSCNQAERNNYSQVGSNLSPLTCFLRPFGARNLNLFSLHHQTHASWCTDSTFKFSAPTNSLSLVHRFRF